MELHHSVFEMVLTSIQSIRSEKTSEITRAGARELHVAQYHVLELIESCAFSHAQLQQLKSALNQKRSELFAVGYSADVRKIFKDARTIVKDRLGDEVRLASVA